MISTKMPPCIRLFLAGWWNLYRSDVDLLWGLLILDSFWGARNK